MPWQLLTEASLKELGFYGTILIAGVLWWLINRPRGPVAAPASPIDAMKEQVKMIPFVLEDVRKGNRDISDLRDDIETLLKRTERMMEIGIRLEDRDRRDR